MAYAYGLLEHGAEPTGLDGGDDTSVFYHAHCQQRTLDLEAHTVAVLEACGYDVTTSEVECCGMAGSFGYKTEYYDLAMAVGDDLAEQVTAADPDVVAASGTSCLEQLEGMDFEPIHPAALCVGRFD
jgi:Fe-S oxidoreductase